MYYDLFLINQAVAVKYFEDIYQKFSFFDKRNTVNLSSINFMEIKSIFKQSYNLCKPAVRMLYVLNT